MEPRHTDVAFFQRPAGRKLLFALLYLSEGAPIGFIWWALPTRLRAEGVSVEEITALTSTLILPWMFKFVWAPVVDTLRTRRWNFPAWIIATQLAMGASLLPLALVEVEFPFMVVLLLLHALVAATQDASIDALSIATVPEKERGSINGWMQTGMLAGRGVFGGGALLMQEHLGDGVILLLVGVIWCSTLLLVIANRQMEVPLPEVKRAERWKLFGRILSDVAASKVTWAGLAFAALGGAGFEAVGGVAGPFLIDRGFSQGEVGWFFGIPVITAMMLGALAGGYAADRVGRTRAVTIFLLSLAVTVVALASTDAMFEPVPKAALITLLAVLYLCIGMFTASSYALFMDITDKRLGATQFSAYMGATNGCESWAIFAVGRLIPVVGYPVGFAVMAGASLLALPLLVMMRRNA